MDRFFATLGGFTVKYRWLMVGFWTVALVFGISFGPRVSESLHGSMDLPGSESEQVKRILKKDFGNKFAYTLVAVVVSPDHQVTDPEYEAAVRDLQTALASEPRVSGVVTYYDAQESDMLSRDGHSTLAVIELDVKNEGDAEEVVPKLRSLAREAGLPDWLEVNITGEPAVYADMNIVGPADMARAEAIALPLALLILIFATGALVAAGIPILLGLTATLVSMGIIFFLGKITLMDTLIENVATMLGLGVGIDYSLFMISRFREELGKLGKSDKDGLSTAVRNVVTTAGKAVFFSGGTVFVSMLAVLFINVPTVRSIAIGASIVVLMAVLVALTLIPALLAILGERINAPRFLSRRLERMKSGGFWHRWAAQVMRYPAVFFVIIMVAFAALAYPIRHLNTWLSGASSLPPQTESRRAFDQLQKDFTVGKTSPINIIVQRPEGKSIWEADSVARVYRLSRILHADPRVTKVEGIVDVDPNLTLAEYQTLYSQDSGLSDSGNIFAQLIGSYVGGSHKESTVVRVTTGYEANSRESRTLVREIREKIGPEIFDGAGDRVFAGGDSAVEEDLDKAFMGAFPMIVGFVLALTFVMMLILFRSILIPLKSIFMNLLSVLASYGVMVLVFQYGVGESLLNFKAPGGLASYLLVFLFCILFGLSMDYEVFLISRVREEHDQTGDNEESVAWGLERTGGIITSAAMIMVVVFGAFALSSLVEVKEFGLGLAVAVFLDATIIRTILVPATMRLLGEWNWWLPRRLRKILPEVRLQH